MKFYQLNLNHCEAAQDLLQQNVREQKVDVAILCEQYRNMEGSRTWISDFTGRAAIWVCGSHFIQEIPHIEHHGFTWVKVQDIYIYSVYVPPSESQEDFENMLDNLARELRCQNPVIVAGDFNAWALEWGSCSTDKRGEALLEVLSSLNLVLVNRGSTPTFERNGRTSIIDLTFMTDSLFLHAPSWQVSDSFNYSDHRAIAFEAGVPEQKNHVKICPNGWNAKSFDREAFEIIMQERLVLTGSCENKTSQLMSLIVNACDASMTRRGRGNGQSPVYWWNDEIAELRKVCHRTRRRAQRARGQTNYQDLRLEHFETCRALKKAIKSSKRRGWKELYEEVDKDPWGRPYKIVMSKLRNSNNLSPTCPDLLERIVTTLFPRQQELTPDIPQTAIDDIPLITKEELLKACNKIGDTKTPGPDGVPNVALKAAIKCRPELFLQVYDSCLCEGVFPTPWKKQRLVLLPKGDKPPNDPSSYRPICLLDTVGKVFERIICNRLKTYTEGDRGLSDRQFGFRKAKSTVDAIRTVMDIAYKAIEGKRWKGGSKEYCAIITLDVKNAFNSAQWNHILEAMSAMEVPAYIRGMIASYFNDRTLIYDTTAGKKTYQITGGVPQGSVLGPDLWNIMYDALLRLPLPDGATTVGFADDVAVVVVGKFLEQVTWIANEAIRTIRQWLTSVGLQLADHKTEVILVTSRKVNETITVRVGDCEITSKSSLKYLGVQIDNRLRFDGHLEVVGAKASRVASTLSRIMPNIGGPRQSRRKLLTSVVSSVLLYAAPIWSPAMKVDTYTRKITPIYRRAALRVICAFRTVSYEAACVISGMPPIERVVEERARTYRRLREDRNANRHGITREEQLETIVRWQERWNSAETGRWTHRLIPNIEGWLRRKHGEVDHYLTQFLSGHGCFLDYQKRFGITNNDLCPTCLSVVEDAEHVFFECPRFRDDRARLNEVLQQRSTPDSIIGLMIASEDNWMAVAGYSATVVKKLREAEKMRLRQGAN